MTPLSFARSSSSFLTHIFDPALRSLALGGLAALLLYVFHIKDASPRLAVWKGVLYAALAMPILVAAVPSLSFPLPASVAALFAKPAAASTPLSARKPDALALSTPLAIIDIPSSNANFEPAAAAAPPKSLADSQSAAFTQPTARAARQSLDIEIIARPTPSAKPDRAAAPLTSVVLAALRTFAWTTLAAAIFCAIAAFLLVRILLGTILGHRLARSAETIADLAAIRILIRQARAAGVSSAPRLAESDLISVPVTLGVFRPVILVPAAWRNWDEPTLRAVIAHEMSHIARHDALTQRLALIHRAIFWFSPLGWWLERALANAAEEASDEAALAAGADRTFYAETLLGFFAALSQSRRRVYWQGVSMAAPGQADRRVDRVLNWKGAVSMRIRKSLAIGLAVVGVPIVLLAAAARPSSQSAAPIVAPAPASPAVPASAAVSAPQPAAAPDPAPAVPSAPVDAAQVMAQVAPAAPPPPPDAAQVPDTPVAPPEPDVAPDAPAILVNPNINPDDRPITLDLQQFNADVANQLQLQGLANLHNQMALNMQTFPQLSPETQEKLEKLEQRLKQLSSKYTENHPEMLRLQREIAELQGRIGTQITQAFANGPFLYQVGPVTRISIRDFGDRFVIVSGDSPIIMSGDSQDVEHATALRSKVSGDFIWFQRDEKSYIIRDQATVSQAKSFFKNEQDLGDKQQALGKQMRALGDQMRDAGSKMRDVHVTVPDLSAQMEKLEAQMKQLSASGGTQREVGDLQRQLGELMRQLGQTQSQAGEQQRQIGEQQRALGDQMRTLGDQMRQIGDQQRQAEDQARQQMKQLLDNALSKGTAQPE